MLMAKNADICSKCLVTEPWVRSFTARSFAQRFKCSNSEYDGFQRHIVSRSRATAPVVAGADCGLAWSTQTLLRIHSPLVASRVAARP